MITLLFFLVGFVLLIKGAGWLVDGAALIADRFRVPSIVIGLTIVAFGTSAPEFVVNLFASLQGNSEIAIGNIVGSNIANILLILGVSSLVYPLVTKRNTVWKEIPLSLLAVCLLGVLASDALIDKASYSALTRIDGMVLLSFFIIFLYYTFGISKVTGQGEVEIRSRSLAGASVKVILGLAGLVVGGKWIVDGAVFIALHLGVSESLIGLTIVAIGTSLPELATSVVATLRKQPDIAIGNVVGSNIFNIFWILGVSSLIHPIPFHAGAGKDMLVMIAASLLLFLTMFTGKRHTIERWEGALMLLFYVTYIGYLIAER
ncbi:calcium/sodium antiporter [Candidatus Peregrinibacteria bacterium]|nr:calcium/sodium antiporter [Candidatus Peregrinibacteria bacterium]